MNRNVKISQYNAENRHNQLHSANPWIVPEIVTVVSLGRSGYYLLLLVSEGHGSDNVKTKTW